MNANDSVHADTPLKDRLEAAASSTKGKHTPALCFAVTSTSGLHASGAAGIEDQVRMPHSRPRQGVHSRRQTLGFEP